ncbi:hypothetical protein BGX38DRAFT_1327656 [Terfezia claveryi]|nr:hypothetical protein BGX38DRAFT_1327656 [Terfezia claveryi]
MAAQLDQALSILRPYLQPITHSLPPFISTPLSDLISPECYSHLILDIDPFTSPTCLRFAISKAVGIAIIAASTIVKVPQLLKLLNSRSAEGVNFTSYLLETAAYIITLAYNFRSRFPFSTFGETALIALQNIIIAALVLHFTATAKNTTSPYPAVFVAGVAAAGYALFTPSIVSTELLRNLQMFVTIPLGLMSKIPQILDVQMNRSTGQLSAFAVFNYLLGSLARVGTTLAEVDDVLILAGFVGGAVLNLVLAAQMVVFWNNKGNKGKKVEETKKKN